MSVDSTPQPNEPAVPAQPQVAPVPTHVVVHMAQPRWQRWSLWIAWTGFVICGLMLMSQFAAFSEYFDTTNGIKERFHSGSQLAQHKIAIINIPGIIMDGSGYVQHQIERIRKDQKNIKGIVVRVNSPGGTITGSDYIFHHLKKLREETKLPMVVSMGSIATSGGYYVSMAVGSQEKTIFAEPTTTTGSIGVMIPHYDLTGLMETLNIRDNSLATHPRKLLLSMTRPMSEDDREILERYMQQSFERFIDIVHYGRPALKNDEHKLEHQGQNLATGEIFTAQQAKTYGLIDEIGFIEEAIARCAEMADVDKDKVRVVEYDAPLTLLGALSAGIHSHRPAESKFLELLEGTAPRAYYLCTTLPPLITSNDLD